MLNKIKLFAVFALLILILIVILQNGQSVETKFLFATVTMPRAALLAITLLIGHASGILMAFYLIKRRSRKN